MTFNGWTFAFEVVNFLVLAYILQRLLYRPLHEALDRRRQALEQAQSEAEHARQEAQAERRQLAERLAALESDRQAVLSTARQEAETERQRLLEEATQDADLRVAQARAALERERDETLEALNEDVVAQACRLAERLLGEVSGADLDTRLAQRLAEGVRSLPEKERLVMARSVRLDDTATLESPHELAPQVIREIEAALAEALRRHVSLRVQAAPELVSGVRLRLDGHVWDASLTGQLRGPLETDGADPRSLGATCGRPPPLEGACGEQQP
jgi:F-type H+-transporting ATPase subunit b